MEDAPNSIIVVTKQQIADYGYQDLADVLRDLPGFDITENASRFGEYITLRGITGNDRFLVLIDGHKLNPASGTFLSIGNSISVRGVEQIEIIYGPASAVYGADAFSGIINIISRKPGNEIVSAAQLAYGSYNTIDAFAESSGKLNENLGYQASFRYYKSDGPDFKDRDAIFDIIDNYEPTVKSAFEQPIDDHTVSLGLNYKKFKLSYYRQHFNEGNAFGLNPSTYIYSKENIWKMSTNSVWLTGQHDFNASGSLHIDLNYVNHVQDAESQFYKWLVPNNTSATFNEYMTGIDITAKATVFYTHNWNDKLQAIGGVEFENSWYIPPYAKDEVLGNSFKYEGNNIDLIKDALSIEEQRTGLFAQFTYDPFKMLSLVLGGRYDYSSRYHGTFNPRLGLVFKPIQGTELKLNYGTAFLAPSLFYQYEQFGTAGVAMLSTTEVSALPKYAGWELKNQEVATYEVIVNQQIGKNIKLKAAFFASELTNLIEQNTFANKAAVDVAARDSVFNKYFNKYTSGIRNENIGEISIQGADVGFQALVNKYIFINASYSYITGTSTVNSIEANVPRLSEHKIWLNAGIRNLFDLVTIAPRVKWVSEMNNLNTTKYPDGKQPGFTNVDLTITVGKFFKYVSVYGNFYNILNTDIRHGGILNQTGVYLADIPQDKFNFRAGIRFDF